MVIQLSTRGTADSDKWFTGIPRLRQWLADSTLERREKHLDVLLNSLRRLFLSIQSWSNNFCGTQTLVFSRDSVEDLLSRVNTKFLKVRLDQH
jgi:hypothetical protein